LIERRPLTDEDVRRLVFGSVELINETQTTLNLSLAPHIQETRKILSEGEFWADTVERGKICRYGMDFGCYTPPSTISLDRELPFSDKPLDLPDLASTLTLYSAVHEVIHVDDYLGGEVLLKATQEHMLNAHSEKLEKAMKVIEEQGNGDAVKNIRDLVHLSSQHYVDMTIHYRSFIILSYINAPQLELIWDRLSEDYFPPYLLTRIEREKGRKHVFDLFTEHAGDYCLIEAFDDYEKIGEKQGSVSIV
jgi:hypothetical protein